MNLSFEAPAAAEVVAAVPVLALSVAPPPTGAQDPSLKPDSVSASLLKTDIIRARHWFPHIDHVLRV